MTFALQIKKKEFYTTGEQMEVIPFGHQKGYSADHGTCMDKSHVGWGLYIKGSWVSFGGKKQLDSSTNNVV